eukprot:361177_1
MRKYIIFLILLSIVKNRAIVPCVTTMTDWYKSGKCQNPDGTYKTRYQHICWTCIEAPTLRLTWDPPTHGHLTGKICPMLHTRSSDFYIWDSRGLRGTSYPPKPLYATRPSDAVTGYGPPKTQLKHYEGIFWSGNPCSIITSAAARRIPIRQFATCIYSLECKLTHEAEQRYLAAHPRLAPHPHLASRAKKEVKAPPLRVKAAPGKRREYAKPRRKPDPPPRASSDFDDMLHYYIGDISDYLNNEYTDYDGYDLDDQFGEMLMDIYMEGYKAGLNVERKWS